METLCRGNVTTCIPCTGIHSLSFVFAHTEQSASEVNTIFQRISFYTHLFCSWLYKSFQWFIVCIWLICRKNCLHKHILLLLLEMNHIRAKAEKVWTSEMKNQFANAVYNSALRWKRGEICRHTGNNLDMTRCVTLYFNNEKVSRKKKQHFAYMCGCTDWRAHWGL